ncbi:hypothetical protein VTJ04DRAFT_6039 [Mycothermus thermophilus]|uniref:uncharacterized protein n=1 Tax=Humicola insolens TaxID=85995 RepID=UPI0037435168
MASTTGSSSPGGQEKPPTTPEPDVFVSSPTDDFPPPFHRAETNMGFRGLRVAFNHDLDVREVDLGGGTKRKLLMSTVNGKPYLPGQPRVRLPALPAKPEQQGPISTDSESVKAQQDLQVPKEDIPSYFLGAGLNGKDPLLDYLDKCHTTRPLDDLLPYMRYIFVQTPSYTHIMPLHHQKTHAREVKVAEHPGLHLVWFYEVIFIKPIPTYFYSQTFWTYLENADKDLYHACLGFMRSYYSLIQFSLDYDEACKLKLIPTKDGTADGPLPTYEEWCEFIEPFARVGDKHVTRRYHYGELRLTRLNRAALIFRGNLAYFHIYPQWGSFLEHTLAPIITIFAVASIVLNAMQVSLATMEVRGDDVDTLSVAWQRFIDASMYFPVAVMLLIAAVIGVSVIGMAIMGVRDFMRGNEVRQKRKKRGDYEAGTRSHGIVW